MSGRAGLCLPLALGLYAGTVLGGCFNEEIVEQDLDGTIVLPADAAPDPRYAGMIYVGIYEGFDGEQLGYPYPTTGPRVGDNPIGDALPYGGTSIGAYTFPCYRAIRCQVLTGRYSDLDALLEVHPVNEEDGAPVDSEGMFDQCSWYYGWNGIDEFSFIGADELDFVQRANGDWVADFRTWHSRLPEGAILWAFSDNDYTSCSPDQGPINRKRSEDDQYFREGSNFNDVLNFPDKYITEGDLVTSDYAVIEAGVTTGYEIVLDHRRD